MCPLTASDSEFSEGQLAEVDRDMFTRVVDLGKCGTENVVDVIHKINSDFIRENFFDEICLIGLVE